MDKYILDWNLRSRIEEERAAYNNERCLGELRAHEKDDFVYIRPYPLRLGILYEIRKDDITKVIALEKETEQTKDGVMIYFKKEAPLVKLEFRKGSDVTNEIEALTRPQDKRHTHPDGPPGDPPDRDDGNYRRPW